MCQAEVELFEAQLQQTPNQIPRTPHEIFWGQKNPGTGKYKVPNKQQFSKRTCSKEAF